MGPIGDQNAVDVVGISFWRFHDLPGTFNKTQKMNEHGGQIPVYGVVFLKFSGQIAQEHALPCLCCWGFVLVHLWSSFSPLFSWRCHKRPTHILLLGRMCSVDGTFFWYSWRVAAFYNIQINILVHLETHDAFRIVSNPNPHAATSGRLCWSEKACALTFTVKGFHEEMDCEQHILHHTPTICNIGFFLGGGLRCDASSDFFEELFL